jgi:hypothetical protein
VSRYFVDKFLFQVYNDDAALEAYRADPEAFVLKWEESDGPRLSDVETTTGHSFTSEERRALAERDFETLYVLGAHPFMLWGVMVPAWQREMPNYLEFEKHYIETIRGHGRPDFAT